MNSPAVHFEFENDRARLRVLYENGDSENLAMAQVGTDLYRLEESSFAGDAIYGNIIRCKPNDDGSVLFEKIAERSKLTTQSGIFSLEYLATSQVRSILDSVVEAGGMWEQAFGGLLIVHTPADMANEILDLLKEALPKHLEMRLSRNE